MRVYTWCLSNFDHISGNNTSLRGKFPIWRAKEVPRRRRRGGKPIPNLISLGELEPAVSDMLFPKKQPLFHCRQSAYSHLQPRP